MLLNVSGLELGAIERKLNKAGEPIEDIYRVTLAKYGADPCKLVLEVREDEINEFFAMDLADLSVSFRRHTDTA